MAKTGKPGRGPELSFRSLQVFAAIQEAGSVVGAARRLRASPSGISQQLTALETSVGAQLFGRTSRPMQLTPAGHIMSRHAHRLLEGMASARADLADLNASILPQLSLGIIDDLDVTLTPALVSSLQARFPNCFVNIYSGRSDQVTARLESREADIAVSAALPDDANSYRAIAIVHEPFVLVAARGVIAPDMDVREQLSERAFVQYSEAMPIGRTVVQHLKRVRFAVTRRFAFEATRSVIAMVVQSGGWTLTTPLNLLDAERFADQVDVLPLPFPQVSRTVYLIARGEELGHLPDALAVECRRLVAERILPRFAAIAPQLATQVTIVE